MKYLLFVSRHQNEKIFIYLSALLCCIVFVFSSSFVLQMIILLGNDHLWCCNLSMSRIRMTWILLTHTQFQLGWINIYFHSIDIKVNVGCNTFISAYIITCSSNPIRMIIHNQDVELTFLFNCDIEQHMRYTKVKDYSYHLFIEYSGNK